MMESRLHWYMIRDNLQNYFNYLSLFISVETHAVFMEAALPEYHSIVYKSYCFLTCFLIFILSFISLFIYVFI